MAPHSNSSRRSLARAWLSAGFFPSNHTCLILYFAENREKIVTKRYRKDSTLKGVCQRRLRLVLPYRNKILTPMLCMAPAAAPALLKDAPILMLDEATSSLDSDSELEVQKAPENLMAGRTTLFIAHRLSTVQHADCILALANGRIVEQGRHSELMTSEGEYHRLYQLQFHQLSREGHPALA